MRSIRRDLTVKLLIGSYFLTFVLCALLYWILKQNATGQFDRALMATAQAITTQVEREGERVVFEEEGAFVGRFGDQPRPEYFQIWLSDGSILTRSLSLGSNDLNRSTGTGSLNLQLPDGRSGRAIALTFVPRKDEEDYEVTAKESQPVQSEESGSATLIYAAGREDLDKVLQSTFLAILGVGLAFPIGITVLVRSVVRRALSSSDRLAREIESVELSNLKHRFSVSDQPEELSPLVRRLNELIERVEEVLGRERRFTADAAHELRTPVAELRTLSEVSLRKLESSNGNQEYPRRFLEDTLRIAIQMEGLVNALLSLARAEANLLPIVPETINLTELVPQVFAGFEEATRRRSLKCHFELPEKALIQADRPLLSAILTNLFSNSAKYASSGGLLKCLVSAENGTRVIELSNSVADLTQDDLLRVFEPFWRKSSARRSELHVGLGLSLVNSYVHLLGGTILAELPEPDEFRITIRLPTARQEKNDQFQSSSSEEMTFPVG